MRDICYLINNSFIAIQRQLKWDYADQAFYYAYTRVHLSPILAKLNDIIESDIISITMFGCCMK